MLDIILNTENLLVVNKPHGVSAVSDQTSTGSIPESVKNILNVKLHPVHRIDKPAAGLIVYAKNGNTMNRLSGMIQQNQIQRTYLVVTKKADINATGTMTHFLSHQPKSNKTLVHSDPFKNFKSASLTYRILERLDNYMLWEIELLTGRTHQIRAQLAAIGCPVRGDVKYGARRSIENRAIMLFSYAWKIPAGIEDLDFFEIKAVPPDFDLWHRFEFIQRSLD